MNQSFLVVSSTRKLISSSSFHRLDIALAVAEALNSSADLGILDGVGGGEGFRVPKKAGP